MKKTLLPLLYAGLPLLTTAMPVLAAQSFGIDTLPDSFQVCSFSQLTGTCTSGTSHPHLHAQIQTLIAGDDERTVISGNNSERDGQPTPPLSDDLNPSSGPSDQAGYYLLGAIPLIVGVGGLIGIDHRLPDDNSGIWKRTNQLDLEYGVALTEIGGSLWFGGESRIGRTFWQTLDASTFSTLTVQGLKYIFSRARPYQSSSPNHWFQGSCCQSFPSGEVTLQASFVTPFIIEYHRQDPWVWGLEALPLYDALARMKTQGHWQTDVLSGWALGTAFGIFAHNRTMPFFLSYMPHGIMVGWHKSF